MKKVLSLLLVLALLLPAAALADQTYDLGIIQVRVPDTAYVEVGDKVNGAVFATIIPDPSNAAGIYANINIVWGEGIGRDDLVFTAEAFGESVVNATASGLAAQGIAVSNEKLLRAELSQEEGYIYLYFTLDADYTGAGVNLATTLYIGQQCLIVDGDGMYTFTYTASSEQEFVDLVEFFDSALVD